MAKVGWSCVFKKSKLQPTGSWSTFSAKKKQFNCKGLKYQTYSNGTTIKSTAPLLGLLQICVITGLEKYKHSIHRMHVLTVHVIVLTIFWSYSVYKQRYSLNNGLQNKLGAMVSTVCFDWGPWKSCTLQVISKMHQSKNVLCVNRLSNPFTVSYVQHICTHRKIFQIFHKNSLVCSACPNK